MVFSLSLCSLSLRSAGRCVRRVLVTAQQPRHMSACPGIWGEGSMGENEGKPLLLNSPSFVLTNSIARRRSSDACCHGVGVFWLEKKRKK